MVIVKIMKRNWIIDGNNKTYAYMHHFYALYMHMKRHTIDISAASCNMITTTGTNRHKDNNQSCLSLLRNTLICASSAYICIYS